MAKFSNTSEDTTTHTSVVTKFHRYSSYVLEYIDDNIGRHDSTVEADKYIDLMRSTTPPTAS